MSLLILGEVDRPLELDWRALIRLAAQLPSRQVRLAAGRDVPGLRLDALLARAGMTANARSLIAESEDGRKVLNVPLTHLRSCLILYRVANAPLPRGLGGPFRLVAPRLGEVKALASLYVSDCTFMRDDETDTINLRP
jgi:DMSO/TMAO reductase YedYZ molybdopterin-dependent catalytic subunit